MTQQQMITAILSAIQTQDNLNLLLQTMIANNIDVVPIPQLQAMCQVLGIDWVDPPSGS